MTSTGSLWTPPAGTVGLDRSATIAEQAGALHDLGYRFAVRTVGLDAGTPGVLTGGEVTSIFAAGLAIGLYQMYPTSISSADQGTTNGAFAASAATALGAPPGLLLWFDFELTYGVTADTMVDYLNNWASAVLAGGYTAGIYVGPQNLLSTSQLSNLPDYHAYWQAAAALTDPAGIARGFQLYQLLPYYTATPPTLWAAGINIDGDIVQADNDKNLPVFWQGPSTSAAR